MAQVGGHACTYHAMLMNIRRTPVRPAEVSAGEAKNIRLAIMYNFQRRIPADVKVTSSVDLEYHAISPYKAFASLTYHFSRVEPFLQDNLRTKAENRVMDRSERVKKYIQWNRELRAKKLDAQFPGVDG